MNLKNEFTNEQKSIWAFDYWCMVCSSNVGVSIHHIFGRSSNSTLNSIPLCDNCHRNYTFLDKSELLQKTIKHLVKNNYQFTEEDIKFYKEKEKYYE